MNLTNQFLQELLKVSITNKSITEILSIHLKGTYIPDELYRKIFQGLTEYFRIHNTVPTLGTLSQYLGDNELNPIIASIGDIYVGDKQDKLIYELQEYIKKARFLELSQTVSDMYNKGEHDDAISFMSKGSQEIHEFSLMGSQYSTVYQDYTARVMDRIDKDRTHRFIPTFMPAFDHFSGGGIELGRSFLAIGRSGAGKSYLLRQLSYGATLAGYDSIHFQGEGKEEEVYEYFDAMWAGVPVYKMKYNNFTEAEMEEIDKKRDSYLANAGEIYVVAFPQFNKASIADCRRKIIEVKNIVEKKGRKLGLATFDYLEKFDPGDKIRYTAGDDQQRHRKMAVAEKITNVATEFDIATVTATQANNIPKSDWNNPDFVITRENISNLKATIDAFSYCITLNQTIDEDDDGVMRVHEEKQRNYKTKSWDRIYKIVMDRDKGWFVDIPKTKDFYWDDVNKKVIK